MLLAAVLLVGGVAASAADGATDAPRPAIGHVFVINLENTSFHTAWGKRSRAPYLSRTLARRGQVLRRYYAIGHLSLPNYIAQISGQGPSRRTARDCHTYDEFVSTGTGELDQALGDGCVYPESVQTIADQLSAKQLTWKGYMEDMATPCRHPELGAKDLDVGATASSQYVTRHNPFVYFHSVVDSPTCATHDVSLDQLETDLAAVESTPNFSLITPGVCNDGHDAECPDGTPGGLVAADAWLAQWVPKILASPAFQADGLLVVTFDEAEADTRSCCNQTVAPNLPRATRARGGGRVGALLVSPFIKAGTTNDTPYNHYSLLCSLEDVFGLAHLGFAAAPGLRCFGSDVYGT
jgi:phosphatidylinositol-3-phosphatase